MGESQASKSYGLPHFDAIAFFPSRCCCSVRMAIFSFYESGLNYYCTLKNTFLVDVRVFFMCALFLSVRVTFFQLFCLLFQLFGELFYFSSPQITSFDLRTMKIILPILLKFERFTVIDDNTLFYGIIIETFPFEQFDVLLLRNA